jgi:hypothetical protein
LTAQKALEEITSEFELTPDVPDLQARVRIEVKIDPELKMFEAGEELWDVVH